MLPSIAYGERRAGEVDDAVDDLGVEGLEFEIIVLKV